MSLGDIPRLISDIASLESARRKVKIKASLSVFFFYCYDYEVQRPSVHKIDHQKIEIEKWLIAIKFLPAIKYSTD